MKLETAQTAAVQHKRETERTEGGGEVFFRQRTSEARSAAH